ncbi:MAG: hypothetical protein K2L40_01175 [Lactobacillus sp.]|nr:hypothetical protein [Lactobacillus sp.]MDE6554566.1 hypothetical protein [Lactobacillus sp.]
MTKIVVQGMNGEMSVDGDKISVKHTAPLFLGKREVVLDIHDLQAVVYKKAHLLINGFLKLVAKGDNPILYQTASLHQMGKDELAIVLRAFENTNPKDAEDFYNYVVGRLDQIKAEEKNHL